MSTVRILLFILLALQPFAASAAEAPLEDIAGEQQAQALFRELRCVVCQGQSLAESNAEIAQDMRMEVRHQLLAGQTPEAIRASLAGRYGESILLTPSLSQQNLFLWGIPIAVLAIGSVLLAGTLRKKR